MLKNRAYIKWYCHTNLALMYVEWQVSPFSKWSNSVIVIFSWFSLFSGIFCNFFSPFFFKECNVWKCRDQLGRPTYTKSNLRFLMMNFTSKYSKNSDFLGFLFFFLQKCCFPQFSVFSILYSIFVIFLGFRHRGKFATLMLTLTWMLSSYS